MGDSYDARQAFRGLANLDILHFTSAASRLSGLI